MGANSTKNPKKISVTRREFLKAVRELTDGLIWISETDASIEPFLGDEAATVTAEALCRQIDVRAETVEEETAELAFERLSATHDWHGPADRLRAKRFRDLSRYLEATLSDLKLIKLGKIRKEVFIVGLDPKGRLAGVRTSSVET